jgi:hypothetical protein
MVTRFHVLWRLVACALAAAAAASTVCAATPPPSPKLMARCTELYTVWWTYEQDPVFLHTGERAQAELAVYDCQRGRYEEGIRTLNGVLQHGGFRFPDD